MAILVNHLIMTKHILVYSINNNIQTAWEHWNLDDAARAECPLTEDYVDTYPMGLTVDFTSQIPIPKGELTNETVR